MIEYNN